MLSRIRSLACLLCLFLASHSLPTLHGQGEDGGGALGLIPGIILPFPEPISPFPEPLALPTASGTLIDFDNLSDRTTVRRQYQGLGVIFDGGPIIRRTGSVGSMTFPNVLESPAVLDLPTHRGPMVMRFTSPVSLVTVYYGSRYGGRRARAILRVYNAAGVEIDRASGATPTGTQSVRQLLSVNVGSDIIRRAEVHYALEQTLDGIRIDTDTTLVETIDNLYFEGSPPPEPEPDAAPVVRITSPTDGATFFGDDLIAYTGTVVENDALGQVTIEVAYLDVGGNSGALPIDYRGAAPNFSFPSPELTRIGLRYGRNRLTIAATDSSGQRHSDSVVVIYGPAPEVTIDTPVDRAVVSDLEMTVRGRIRKEFGTLSRRDVRIDLRLGSDVARAPVRVDALRGSAPDYTFEATVSLLDPGPRTFNRIVVTATDEGGASGSDSVLVEVNRPDRVSASLVALQTIEQGILVAGRPTVVRLHPTRRIGARNNGVRAELHAFRGGVELPDSPIFPSVSETVDLLPGDSWVDVHGTTDKTWNFLLPTTWTRSGDLELVGVIDPDGDLEECESCEGNNTADLTVRFETSEPLTVTPVRMRAMGGDGVVREVTNAQALQAMRDIRRLLPYSTLTIRSPVRMNNRAGSTAAGLGNFLDDLYDRFTCFDSNGGDVFGWLGDWLVDCRWSNYFVGLLPTLPNREGEMFFPGGLASLESPGGVADLRPSTAVHELAHALSRSHAGNGHGELDGGGFDDRFPHPHGTLGGYGFDIENWHAVRPEWSGASAVPSDMVDNGGRCDDTDSGCPTHDYLAYGADPFWTSAYTWNAIFRHGFTGSTGGLFLSADGGGAGEAVAVATVVHVRGRIDADGKLVSRPFYTLPTPDRFKILPTDGEIEARAVDILGRTLASRSVELVRIEDAGEEYFSFLLPFPEGTAGLVLLYAGTVQEERRVSANAPELTVLSPAVGSRVSSTDVLRIQWTASDLDRDALTYGVQFSDDRGETWKTLGMNLTEMALDVPASELTGSANALVRVMATDGVLASRATSGFFSVEDQAPFVVILWPEDGAVLPQNERLIFQASVADPEGEAIKRASIRWSSSLNGNLPTGATVDVSSLKKGTHVITVTATDDAGNKGYSTVEVYVGVDRPEPQPVGSTFLRGDVSGDGELGLADPVQLLNFLFLGGTALACEDAADANDDGALELTDGVQVLNFLFLGGDSPALPFPNLGIDETDDSLTCSDA